MANDYPDATRDRQGAGGAQEEDNRRKREEQADKLNRELGIDGGNRDSFVSGRNTYEGYLADQRARTTNEPGGGDGEDRGSSDRNSGGGGNSSGGDWGRVSQASNPALDQQNQILTQMMEQHRQRAAEIAAAEAARKAKADELFTTLQGRAQQSLDIAPTDPNIRNQVDYYRAEQDRARRNAVSDMAEAGSPLGDTRKRMSEERVGQNVGSFQSELMARELSSRRSEISDALNSMGGMLSTDQQAGLQRELSNVDQAIKQYELGISDRSLGLERELGLGDLGLRRELGMGDLGLRRDLGFAGLDMDRLKAELLNRQFYADLGLRAEDQSNYWNDPLRKTATR